MLARCSFGLAAWRPSLFMRMFRHDGLLTVGQPDETLRPTVQQDFCRFDQGCVTLAIAQFTMAQKEGAQLQYRTQLLVGVNLPRAFSGNDLDFTLLPMA